jgi:hypothetical protein
LLCRFPWGFALGFAPSFAPGWYDAAPLALRLNAGGIAANSASF